MKGFQIFLQNYLESTYHGAAGLHSVNTTTPTYPK